MMTTKPTTDRFRKGCAMSDHRNPTIAGIAGLIDEHGLLMDAFVRQALQEFSEGVITELPPAPEETPGRMYIGPSYDDWRAMARAVLAWGGARGTALAYGRRR
jgi:hypothetical protein